MAPHVPTIPALDGLRGFACLLVLLAHAAWKGWFFDIVGAGQVGVMLFFTLSGFLMAHHYLPGQFSVSYWLAFLTRRFFRVYPTFAVVAFALWIAHRLQYPFARAFTGHQLIDHWLLQEGVGIFWTIPVEMKFYAWFPVLALVMFPLPSSVVPVALTALWIALLPINLANDRTSLWPYLSFFIGGVVMGSLYGNRLWSRWKDRYWNWIALLCITMIVLWIPHRFSLMNLVEINVWEYRWGFAPLMALTVMSVSRSSGTMRWLFANRAARFTGHISYSLYLINSFMFSWMKPHMPLAPLPAFVVAVTTVIIVAWLLYLAVEQPGNRIGRSLSARIMAGKR